MLAKSKPTHHFTLWINYLIRHLSTGHVEIWLPKISLKQPVAKEKLAEFIAYHCKGEIHTDRV